MGGGDAYSPSLREKFADDIEDSKNDPLNFVRVDLLVVKRVPPDDFILDQHNI